MFCGVHSAELVVRLESDNPESNERARAQLQRAAARHAEEVGGGCSTAYRTFDALPPEAMTPAVICGMAEA